MLDEKDVRIGIDGLNCASCAARAQKAILAIPGVKDANVNFATENAEVHYFDPADESQINAAIVGAGYSVRTEELTLQIDGMSCASCVGRVEKALLAHSGVQSASVNLATETAHITYTGGLTSDAALSALVTDAGYPARVAGAVAAEKRDEKRDVEIATLRREVLVSAVLALPVVILAMGGHFVPAFRDLIGSTIGFQVDRLIQLGLTTAILAGPGRVFLVKGVPALFKRAPDMNSLVALGSGAAWIFSVVVTFAPQLLPEGTRGVYFEAAAVIVTLILFGRLLEARAKGRTGAAIRHLVGLRPKVARVTRDGNLVEISHADLRLNDLIHIRPGDRIATDGTVEDGQSFVDESMITGEPAPVRKVAGNEVVGGTINTTGTFTFRATRIGADTVLSQIIALVENAQGAKLPIQALVDKVTGWFVPAVLGVAALTVLVWLVFAPAPAISLALVAGVSVLIIACPCAMGLATPTSIMVGTGRGAEIGVLFRKGDALQELSDARVIAIDKTGTLTEGTPRLTDLRIVEGFDETDVLTRLAALESHSEHPVATAIVAEAENRGIEPPDVSDFEALAGFGVTASLQGEILAAGADRYMERLNVTVDAAMAGHAADLASAGKTPLYVAINGRLAAVVAVADAIKETTPQAIRSLHDMGLKVVMISGDNRHTAEAVAATLGIDEVIAEVLPEGKVAAIEQLKTDNGKVAFVGDGINDAPALAAADVGIAIGTGTDVAIESADVVLMRGELTSVPAALALSRAVMRNIRQNLFWAFGYNVLLIPVAAGVLYPFSGVLLSPMFAAAAMALSSVFVLTNALRLRRFKAQ